MAIPGVIYEEYECPTCCGLGVCQDPFPHSLRARREAAGVSLRSFAKSVGLSPSYICDVELGRRRCTAEIEAFYAKLR